VVSILAHFCIFDMDFSFFDGTNSNTIDIYSTNVPGSLEGRGVGKLLADEAFQLAKERGLTIRPTSPAISAGKRTALPKQGDFLDFFVCVLYSTLAHLLPLRLDRT
jgi:hypothetical protein